MTLNIEINSTRWRKHLAHVFESFTAARCEVVPVIKSNGYGLGQDFLGSVASQLKSSFIAVGTVYEVESMLGSTDADILVLEPFEPRDENATATWKSIDVNQDSHRVVRVVASRSAFESVMESDVSVRVLVEARTDLNRFGLTHSELLDLWPALSKAVETQKIKCDGLTFHFPLETQSSDVSQVKKLVEELTATPTAATIPALWVSHLTVAQIESLRNAIPDVKFRMRIGSHLWLGDRGALKTFATVLAVTPIVRGDKAGYRRKKVPGKGWIVTVSGGTAHGIALTAPSNVANARQRAIAFANGLFDAIGVVRSPFTLDGKRLMFLEAPHQHVSQLFWPAVNTPPVVGDRLEATVRFTTTHADAVIEIS